MVNEPVDLEQWIAFLTQEMGMSAEVPVDDILELSKDVAHGVARPAVPVTAFVAGYLAGFGYPPEAAIRSARDAVEKWPQ